MEIQFVDLFIIVPAEHVEETRFLAWVWTKTVSVCTDPLEAYFTEGFSSSGEGPPTHYACHKRVSTITLDMHIKESKERSAKAFEWCWPEPTMDKDIALSHFAMMLLPKQEALDYLGLKPVEVK